MRVCCFREDRRTAFFFHTEPARMRGVSGTNLLNTHLFSARGSSGCSPSSSRYWPRRVRVLAGMRPRAGASTRRNRRVARVLCLYMQVRCHFAPRSIRTGRFMEFDVGKIRRRFWITESRTPRPIGNTGCPQPSSWTKRICDMRLKDRFRSRFV